MTVCGMWGVVILAAVVALSAALPAVRLPVSALSDGGSVECEACKVVMERVLKDSSVS